MFRTSLAAAAALLLAACSTGPKDMTAQYSLGQDATLTAKVAANGDGRLDQGDQVMIRKGGKDYVVLTDSQGRFAATVDDFVGTMGEMMREAGVPQVAPAGQPEFDLVRQGDETVAEKKGELWKVRAKPVAGKPGPAINEIEVVVSTDPAYANLAAVMRLQSKLSLAIEAQRGGASPLAKRIDEVLGKGLVLRFGDQLKLKSLTQAPIDAGDFALPAVVDRTALKARLVAERQRQQAAAAQMMEQMRKQQGKGGKAGPDAPGAMPAPGGAPAPAAPAAPAPAAPAAPAPTR